MELFFEDIERILLSALLGAIIGLEREWSGKSAGFRTMMLVCIGSTLFTMVSFKMGEAFGDVTRIASNIATGIGFIGAGLIFKGDQNVKGLTTAATVWATGAIGMAVAIDAVAVSIFATVLLWVILVVLDRFEQLFQARFDTREYRVSYRFEPGHDLPEYRQFFTDGSYKLIDSKMEKKDGNVIMSWTIRASGKRHDAALHKLIHDQRVITVDY